MNLHWGATTSARPHLRRVFVVTKPRETGDPSQGVAWKRRGSIHDPAVTEASKILATFGLGLGEKPSPEGAFISPFSRWTLTTVMISLSVQFPPSHLRFYLNSPHLPLAPSRTRSVVKTRAPLSTFLGLLAFCWCLVAVTFVSRLPLFQTTIVLSPLAPMTEGNLG